MSTTVKKGWLHDNNGEKFAPKTLTSQVQTSDGVLIEDRINSLLKDKVDKGSGLAYLDSNNETIPDVNIVGGADIDVTAEVGQTIIVKEVDENGKPTKWESADYPLTVNEIIPQTTFNATFDNYLECYTYHGLSIINKCIISCSKNSSAPYI